MKLLLIAAAFAAFYAQPASAQRNEAPIEIDNGMLEVPCSPRGGDLGLILETPRQGQGNDR